MDNLGGLCFIFLATGLLYSALGTYQLRGSWKTRQTDRRQSRRKLWIGLVCLVPAGASFIALLYIGYLIVLVGMAFGPDK